MMIVTAPERVHSAILNVQRRVFLAGSIEMGAAREWQKVVIDSMRDLDYVVLFNPRRPDWDSSWKQDADNPKFREQVDWELDMLEESDVAFFYFDQDTRSPVTLLELGHVADSHHEVIVVCPPGYWRRGNVQVFCARQGIPLLDSLEEGIATLREIA